MQAFLQLRMSLVIIKDKVEDLKEVSLLQEIVVILSLAGLSEDGSRFIIRNEVLRQDGKYCARVTSTGAGLI